MAQHDAPAKDLYSVLGVPYDCTNDSLKRAYRSLARRHHPDTNAGCKLAQGRFQEIGAAYAVLSDRTRRARYDLALRQARPPAQSSWKRQRSEWFRPGDDEPPATRTGPADEDAGRGAGAADRQPPRSPIEPMLPLWWSPVRWSTTVWVQAARAAQQGSPWWTAR